MAPSLPPPKNGCYEQMIDFGVVSASEGTLSLYLSKAKIKVQGALFIK